MKIDLQINAEDHEFESEDFQGISLDNALDVIKGKNRPECIAVWPNKAYRDFMKLVIKGNITNKIGDKIIKFFNKHNDLKESLLPNSMKKDKEYLNQIKSPSINFKERVIATYNEIDFTFYYHPIF